MTPYVVSVTEAFMAKRVVSQEDNNIKGGKNCGKNIFGNETDTGNHTEE